MAGKNLKIHWAFDPYAELDNTWLRSYEAIEWIKKENSIEVVPTYFLGSDAVHWIGHIIPSNIESLKPMVELAIKEKLKEFEMAEISEPQVQVIHCRTRRGDVKAAVDFFKQEKSDLVILNTHAKEGLRRLLLGSFAENFLLQAKTPLLLVSPHTKKLESMSTALFPTDFSKHSFEGFEKCLAESFSTGKKIILYSKVEAPGIPLDQSDTFILGNSWETIDHFIKDSIQHRKEESKKWISKAEGYGVSVEVVIDDQPGDLAESILDHADQHKVGMISMISFANKMDTVLVGSLTRDIIRHAKVPVLVRHFEKA